jgi:hypothetical protein
MRSRMKDLGAVLLAFLLVLGLSLAGVRCPTPQSEGTMYDAHP